MIVKIPNEVLEIVKNFKITVIKPFLVGGCVRDLIREEAEGLPIKPKDWDITTNAKPEEIQNFFSDFRSVAGAPIGGRGQARHRLRKYFRNGWRQNRIRGPVP